MASLQVRTGCFLVGTSGGITTSALSFTRRLVLSLPFAFGLFGLSGSLTTARGGE